MFDPRQSVFYGMPTADLQTALVTLQQAYVSLAAGGKPISVSYTQGDGAKSVTYSRADMSMLTALIGELKAMLGITVYARRPLRFRFR